MSDARESLRIIRPPIEDSTLTAADLCNMIGMAKTTLYRWEREHFIPTADRQVRGVSMVERVYGPEDVREILKLLQAREKAKPGQPYSNPWSNVDLDKDFAICFRSGWTFEYHAGEGKSTEEPVG